MIRNTSLLALIFFGLLLFVQQAPAFQKNGCGVGKCTDCHTLDKKDAASLLSIQEENIVELKLAEVPGLWELDIKQQDKVIPIYLDFSLQYLINGSVIKIAEKEDITQKRFVDLNRIDVSAIPLDDALVEGDPKAPHKIIVFDDPECPYCQKVQIEMKKVIKTRPDIAFFIKMYPLPSHPNAYDKAKAIICSKSITMLEKSLAGQPLDPPTCETDQIEKNMELAKQLGIRSTPTLILPDGRVIPGYKPADKIINLVDNPAK